MFTDEVCFVEENHELPVWHNEDELNLELSKSLPWGHDLSKVSFWMEKKKQPGNLVGIMLDLHTKCFLLLQVNKNIFVFLVLFYHVKHLVLSIYSWTRRLY